MLTVNAVWRRDQELPTLDRLVETAKQLAHEHQWSQRRCRAREFDGCFEPMYERPATVERTPPPRIRVTS